MAETLGKASKSLFLKKRTDDEAACFHLASYHSAWSRVRCVWYGRTHVRPQGLRQIMREKRGSYIPVTYRRPNHDSQIRGKWW